MTDLFTPDWAEALTEKLAAIDAGPGGSGLVEWVVTGGDPDRVWVQWRIDDGRITNLSVSGAPDSGGEAEVTVPLSRAHAEGVLSGEIDPAQAYMRGDLKPEGSSRAWFALVSVLARPETQDVLHANVG